MHGAAKDMFQKFDMTDKDLNDFIQTQENKAVVEAIHGFNQHDKEKGYNGLSTHLQRIVSGDSNVIPCDEVKYQEYLQACQGFYDAVKISPHVKKWCGAIVPRNITLALELKQLWPFTRDSVDGQLWSLPSRGVKCTLKRGVTDQAEYGRPESAYIEKHASYFNYFEGIDDFVAWISSRKCRSFKAKIRHWNVGNEPNYSHVLVEKLSYSPGQATSVRKDSQAKKEVEDMQARADESLLGLIWGHDLVDGQQ
jgi:hypothetical protein